MSVVIESSDGGFDGGAFEAGGDLHCSRDVLNICVKMGAGWRAQALRQGEALRACCFAGVLSLKEPAHVLFTCDEGQEQVLVLLLGYLV